MPFPEAGAPEITTLSGSLLEQFTLKLRHFFGRVSCPVYTCRCRRERGVDKEERVEEERWEGQEVEMVATREDEGGGEVVKDDVLK